jgi:hypothetical protein
LDCFDRSRRGEPPTRATNAAFGYGADGNLLLSHRRQVRLRHPDGEAGLSDQLSLGDVISIDWNEREALLTFSKRSERVRFDVAHAALESMVDTDALSDGLELSVPDGNVPIENRWKSTPLHVYASGPRL